MKQRVINTSTLVSWLQKGMKVNILDVRPLHEREEWQIPGSIHIDTYDKLKQQDPEALSGIELDKSFPVVAVCEGGATSLIAAELLQKAGYEAYSLHGGMKEWSLSWNTASLAFDDFEVIQIRRTGKGCLSYLVISEGEAMLIDASLPVEVYHKLIEQKGLNLIIAADTHIHADHLSRTRDLALSYGLQPSLPANDKIKFPFIPIYDSSTFSVGRVSVGAIHTPGHTAESTSFMVGEKVVFTGDTLFTNGVGRPDLKASQEEAKNKAIQLFASIQKLISQDPSLIIMPGHTDQPVAFDNQPIQSSLREVVKNTSLLKKSEREFVQSLLNHLPNPPENYLRIVERNLSGDFTDVNPIDLEAGANRCAIS